MDQNDIKKRAKKEQNRLKRILKDAQVHPDTMKIIEPVIENTAWMRVKLEDAMALIGAEEITVEYDNGGGQSGVRENPNLKAYEALWKSYMQGVREILGAMSNSKNGIEANTVPQKQTMLEIVKAKRA